MTTDLVSVVIPAYNGGELLRGAVESVLAQTYASIELIVVDDGSTEDVLALLDPYAGRLRVIRQANGGTAAARNRGVQEATGPFIALLDQDDLWDEDKLERQLPYFANPNIGLVHSGARFVNLEGRVTSEVTADPTLDVHSLLAACRVTVQTAILRRSALDAIGPFDQTLSAADDWDMWIRFAEASQLAATPHTLATIRAHPGNQSRDAERMYRSASKMLDKHRHIHGSCRECKRALRRADALNRESYYGRRREEARRLASHGRRLEAARVTMQAVMRNPRALFTTPHHHLRRALRVDRPE